LVVIELYGLDRSENSIWYFADFKCFGHFGIPDPVNPFAADSSIVAFKERRRRQLLCFQNLRLSRLESFGVTE